MTWRHVPSFTECSILWDIMPCSPFKMNPTFWNNKSPPSHLHPDGPRLIHGGFLLALFLDPENLTGKFLRNVGWLSKDHKRNKELHNIETILQNSHCSLAGVQGKCDVTTQEQEQIWATFQTEVEPQQNYSKTKIYKTNCLKYKYNKNFQNRNKLPTYIAGGHAVAWWLIHYAASRNVAGSRPDERDFLNWPNPSDRTMALGSTQPLTEMSTRSTLPI
jgi:hypothetical protein